MSTTASIVSIVPCSEPSRKGESSQIPSRTPRFLANENFWYFRTREGHEVGPYNCRSRAEEAAGSFATFTARVNDSNLDDLIYIHLDRICKQAQEEVKVPLRRGEDSAPLSRRPRIIHRNQQWHFTTREGRTVGPYETPEEARESAKLFTSFAKTISSSCIEGLIDTMNDNLDHA